MAFSSISSIRPRRQSDATSKPFGLRVAKVSSLSPTCHSTLTDSHSTLQTNDGPSELFLGGPNPDQYSVSSLCVSRALIRKLNRVFVCFAGSYRVASRSKASLLQHHGRRFPQQQLRFRERSQHDYRFRFGFSASLLLLTEIDSYPRSRRYDPYHCASR
jgi:hypothetical protein